MLLPVTVALVGCGHSYEIPYRYPTEVTGHANLDDDDLGGEPDWDDDALVAGEDDLPDIHAWTDCDHGAAVTLALTGDVDLVRVWDGDTLLLDVDHPTATYTWSSSPELSVEFGGFLATATLSLTPAADQARDVACTAGDLALLSAPLILNHHLQVAEQEMMLDAGAENEAFVAGFDQALGDMVITGSVRTYQWDVWVQDEFEFATTGGMGVVIDSVRSMRGAGLDDFPEDNLEAPGMAVLSWGLGPGASSQDSFGNLEVSPPVTVDGVEYPFGRIYWGEWQGEGPVDELTELLEAQKVQDPFQVDVSWLCVGHVDEFSTFLPDPSAPKGFRLYLASPRAGWTFLESLDPTLALPRYAEDHGYDTVGDLLADTDLAALQEELQVDYVDVAREVFKRELGLDDADIVDLPAVYEVYPGCGGATLSLIPGTVNLTVAQPAGGETHLFLPDPFFRADGAPIEDDPVVSAIEALLPPDAVTHWLDDWDTYHLMMGEVHCGTNTRRAQTRPWTDARHLLEGE